MKAVNKQSELRPDAFAISVWENEGGAPAPDGLDCDDGRGVESDRSWTVYHVFTGAPARIDGRLMLGLSCQEATDSMVSTHPSNVARRTERGGRPPSKQERSS